MRTIGVHFHGKILNSGNDEEEDEVREEKDMDSIKYGKLLVFIFTGREINYGN